MTRHRRATETHLAGGEVRGKGDGRTIEARVVTYNTVDTYGSVWAPGVFTESLNRRLPVLAWGHDWLDPIGRGTSWRDGTDGPYVTFRMSDPKVVPRAAQAVEQIRDGTIVDVSVGFWGAKRRDPTDAEMTKWPGVQEVIVKADLDETSLVLRGAVPGAQLVGQRSRGDAKSPGWRLARDYADGRISYTEFREKARLEAEADEALDMVLGSSLRSSFAELKRRGGLTAEAIQTYVRADRELDRRKRVRDGRLS